MEGRWGGPGPRRDRWLEPAFDGTSPAGWRRTGRQGVCVGLFAALLAAAACGQEPPPTESPPSGTSQPAALDRSRETRRAKVARFGGNRRTEDAVEIGLAWLARHQDRDGTWSRVRFARHCPPDDRCPGAAVYSTGDDLRPGLTGLCTLAFLGAGYTDASGPYRDNVRRAVAALLGMQQRDGGFGVPDARSGYNDAIATFALAEYAALTGSRTVRPALQRAVTRLVLSQQQLGGWDYGRQNDSGRDDTSITAWMVQALLACRAAGVQVPARPLVKAALHFQRAARPDGRVRYADSGTGFSFDKKTHAAVYRYGPAMVAAGLTCETLLDWRPDSPLARRQVALLLEQPPSAGLLRGGDPTQLHSYYYWYYGTVALFQTGGKVWERWNGHLRDAILPLQDRRKSRSGAKPHSYGSWPPFGPRWGKWGRHGSRVYTTAICVLTLEIYYRHDPAYLGDGVSISAKDWLAFIDEADARDRAAALKTLPHVRLETSEGVLLELIGRPDARLALPAALGLAELGSPAGRATLQAALPEATGFQRRAIEQALRRIARITARPPARGTVRLVDLERQMATLDLPGAYVGMRVRVVTADRPGARLRVVRRFSGKTVVVARFDPRISDPPPDGAVVVEQREAMDSDEARPQTRPATVP